MALTFSRSMRSLQADSFRSLLAWLLLGMALLLAWSGWFFLARVGIYQTGQISGATRDGLVTAVLPPDMADRLVPGRPALLYLDGVARPVSATLLEVANRPDLAGVRVTLLPEEYLPPLPAGLTGYVDVEVESISPARLVIRASEKVLNSAQLSPGLPTSSD